MIQKELQALIGKIYITYQIFQWKAWGEYQKDGNGAFQLAEADERTLDIIMTGKEAAKWTF